jgi:hypothetical protein
MRATSVCLGALLWAGVAVCAADGSGYCSPVFKRYLPHAPDACGPGFYHFCPNGTVYGPNYCLRPPFAPFNGILPGPTGQAIMGGRPDYYPGQGAPGVVFPHHPYARSPRDFFMFSDALEDNLARDRRPLLVP